MSIYLRKEKSPDISRKKKLLKNMFHKNKTMNVIFVLSWSLDYILHHIIFPYIALGNIG